jgi:glycosyltransferase involved in cell wall biosynthesis
MRIAIVTAYFKEDRATVERCLASVRSQTVPVEHILVADGHPQDWVRATGVRHIALDRSHGDFGDTPRMVGLVLAIREGYDAVQFLDADNLLYPRHAALATELLRGTGAHMLVLKRRLLRPDGSALNFTAPEDESLTVIDTNCYLFARSALATAIKWALVPRELAFMGDRVFRSVFSKVGHPVAVMPEPTVGYTCMWEAVYRAAGEEPPPGCHDLTALRENAAVWWSGLDEARRDEIQVALGVKISVLPS